MRKELYLPLAIIAITATGYGLLDSHLKSQDTSMSGYLSGAMLAVSGVGGESQLIRVNLHNHQLAMYENSQLYKLTKIAATGNPYDGTRSPTGEFRILSKERMHKSRLSGVLMPWALRFYEGYYFHDIPLTPAGARITTKYSHGCIRLPTALAEEFYDWARVGAFVQMYRASLVRDAASATVYKLTEDGFAHPIATEAAFVSRGFRWEDIVIVPSQEIHGLAVGETLY